MMNFCVESVQVDERMRGEHGVLHGASLFLSSETRALTSQLLLEAEQDKQAMLQQAQEQAEQTMAEAEAAGAEAVEQAQVTVVEQADALFATLDDAMAKVSEGIRPMVIKLALELFDRLVLETTAEERAAAAYRRLVVEVPLKLVDAVLKVHPDELSIYEAMVPPPRWALQPDTAIARGACRVDANSGEWSAGFDFAAKALRGAFVHATEPGVVAEVDSEGLEGDTLEGEALDPPPEDD